MKHPHNKTKTGQKSGDAASRSMPVENMDKIGEVAMYYGFAPVKSPSITKADTDAARSLREGDFIDDETESHGHLPLHVEEKIAILRTYQDEGWYSMAQPVYVYLKDPCRGCVSSSGKKTAYNRYADLEILGSSGAIAEATLIQAGRAMLAEEGYEDTRVEINSVGDRDSMSRFNRELTSYYRKNIDTMTPEGRQLFKKDPYALLVSHDKENTEINAKAPRTIDFLSENSRRHLEEVLEYLEALGVPYSINNSLIGNKSYCTETIFSVIDATESKADKDMRVLAIGMRYNGLAKRAGMKKDIQGVGLSLLIKNNGNDLRDPLKRVKRPIASFVQLGAESKLMSLDIVERLRKNKIPLYISLAKDRLGAQVSVIEKHHTPYVIVIGKKEAVDKTAIVRRVDTYSQEVVPIEELPEYMKKVEKSYWGK
ncbi:MAG: hypothetical protein KGI49_01055 [Patescibacteria group bacterium]|nr:hypothetical protein [Patescibacteria group bacterium]